MKKIFALADCNNFYVSCERVFNRRIANLPVVVLSNNDGCVIALSEEAKSAGLKRGTPIFKCREIAKNNNTEILSSNYALYGDMSTRVMKILSESVPEIEVYSIDEAFLSLDGIKNAETMMRNLKEKVQIWTGMPLSIGIGTTKTLAKCSAHFAKKNPSQKGVFNIDENNRNDVLSSIAVENVWGIGYASKRLLNAHGIYTALDFSTSNSKWVRSKMGICGERTHAELNGLSCIELETAPKPRKTVISSRSFGNPVTKLIDLEEAVSTYAAIAAAKMRRENLFASALSVHIATNYFKENELQYTGSLSCTLNNPTSSPQTLSRESITLLRKIFKAGYKYKKASVLLFGLVPNDQMQYSLFSEREADDKREIISLVIAETNKRFGINKLKTASCGFEQNWKMRRNYMSPRWTTNWEDIPLVKCQ